MAKEQEPTYQTIKTFAPISAKQVYDALMFAKTAFVKEEDYIYVFDTNSLLKTYYFDSDSLGKLKSFFEGRQMYATHTIEVEFIRNQERVGESNTIVAKQKFEADLKKLGESMDSLYKSEFVYAMIDKDLLDKLKSLHNEYDKVATDVSKYVKSVSEDDIEKVKMECFKLIVDYFDFSIGLNNDQYEQLKEEYDGLIKDYHNQNYREKHFIPIFPGRGETKKKNKEGDYFIFHELLELAKKKNKSIVFVTSDVAKNDWVDENGKTFESYQIMFYALTGHSFMVQKYADFLKNEVNIDPQVLLYSENVAAQTTPDDGEISFSREVQIFMHKFSRLTSYLISRIEENGFDLGRTRSPWKFFNDYRRWIKEDYIEQIDYIWRCRNAIMHPSISNVYSDYNVALQCIKRLRYFADEVILSIKVRIEIDKRMNNKQ